VSFFVNIFPFIRSTTAMRSQQIAPNIYWVGFVDWNIRNFHGYETHRGSSYNAYLILDEKIALIDAVKGHYSKYLLENIAERIEPAKIDYLISNHTEPDHSGGIAAVLKHAPNAQVIASEKGQAGLEKYYQGKWNYRVVKTGDTLSLGRDTLHFINTPMLHWPDSMFTYLPDRKLLFSMDAFGQHLASSSRFDADVDFDVLMAEAKTYYANIIMHLGNVVARTLKQTETLPIETICPSHGVIWIRHIHDIIAAYRDWAVCKPRNKVLVIYDSMWQSTEIMAGAVADGAAEENVEVKLLRLGANDMTELATETLDAGAIAIGSPTLNNNMMPTVAAFLTYIKGLKPKNKLSLTFGSYGWSGGAVEQAAAMLKETGLEPAAENIACQYRPDQEILDQCRRAGKILAQKVKQLVQTPERNPA
jgi:anaerobic nitric oxide reductase flavorubredoxin